MNHPGLATQIGAATNYEEAVVPALMSEWAPRVAAAAGIRPGHRVLDVACGTGVLSRVVAEAVGPAGSVTGLDVDPGMLTIAARAAPGISWHRGVAENLPFRDATFDAVVSQFGLMFFQDRSRALREMWRVLRPGGRMAVAVWASLEDTPAYAAEVELVERMAGPAAANVLRSPFVLGDRAVLERTFARRRDSAQLADHPRRHRPVPQHPRHGGHRLERLAANYGRSVGPADGRAHPDGGRNRFSSST